MISAKNLIFPENEKKSLNFIKKNEKNYCFYCKNILLYICMDEHYNLFSEVWRI